jgi:hypothetical protein
MNLRATGCALHVCLVLMLSLLSLGRLEDAHAAGGDPIVLEDFESIPVGPIAGQHGWTATSLGTVVADDSYEGAQSLLVNTFDHGGATYVGDFAGYSASTAYITMYLKGGCGLSIM